MLREGRGDFFGNQKQKKNSRKFQQQKKYSHGPIPRSPPSYTRHHDRHATIIVAPRRSQAKKCASINKRKENSSKQAKKKVK
ncbi:hypothetical protein ES288_A13G241500v1 [Gossypium darwinii]|uniref:Uncharacterized protein n=1 Tax=Gossypium darwinii TaxID=34276 RepID=A0A5D2E3C4_GOSDA|nr:hypothetical protein ES288_A13G241500v1 [Gossypium darwinii]